jgi:sigma-B regulation protein RsbU (phosphoserine phosphatase)
VVGLLEFAPYGQETVRLEPGDTIIIFSDGVSEALNSAGDEFGDARLQAIAEQIGQATAQTIVDRIVSDVRAFTKGAAQSDDITVMVIRYLGAGT